MTTIVNSTSPRITELNQDRLSASIDNFYAQIEPTVINAVRTSAETTTTVVVDKGIDGTRTYSISNNRTATAARTLFSVGNINLQPDFTKITAEEKKSYDRFFDYTSEDPPLVAFVIFKTLHRLGEIYSTVEAYANGASLGKLTDLARKAYEVVKKTNPVVGRSISTSPGEGWSSRFPSEIGRNEKQWELNMLSKIKKGLARAVEMKRAYYENNFFGKITKFFLKLFGRWNGGNTAAIVKAEDVLLQWDSRKPVCKITGIFCSSSRYTEANRLECFSSDTSQFFNYNPSRLIEISSGERINYSALRV